MTGWTTSLEDTLAKTERRTLEIAKTLNEWPPAKHNLSSTDS